MSVLGAGFPSVIQPSRPAAGYGNPNTNGLMGKLGQEYTDLNSGQVWMKGGALRELGWFPIGSATGNATLVYGAAGQISPLGVAVQAGPAVWYGMGGQIWIKTDPGNDSLNWYPLVTDPSQLSIINGDPFLYQNIYPYSLSATTSLNADGVNTDVHLSWTYPASPFPTPSPATAQLYPTGLTHRLYLQRATTATNTPLQPLNTGTISTGPANTPIVGSPTADPDWVTIKSWTTPADFPASSYVDTKVYPNPTFHYRLLLFSNAAATGLTALIELDWNVVTVTAGQSNPGDSLWVANASSDPGVGANAQFVSVDYDSSNNIYALGIFTGRVGVGTGGSKQFINNATGSAGAFIAKFTQGGTLLAIKDLSNGFVTVSHRIKATSSGCVISLSFQNTINMAKGEVTAHNAVSNGGYDVVVAKYDSSLNWQWHVAFGSDNDDQPFALTVDSSDNVWASGILRRNNNSSAINVNGTSVTPVGSTDCFLVKLKASDGSNLITPKLFGTSGQYVRGLGLDYDPTTDPSPPGGVVLCGYFGGTVNFGGTSKTAGASGQNMFLARYNSAGTLQWVNGFPSSGVDYPYSVAVNSVGRIAVCGAFLGASACGDPNHIYQGSGGSDGFSAAYERTGSFQGNFVGVTGVNDGLTKLTDVTIDGHDVVYAIGTIRSLLFGSLIISASTPARQPLTADPVVIVFRPWSVATGTSDSNGTTVPWFRRYDSGVAGVGTDYDAGQGIAISSNRLNLAACGNFTGQIDFQASVGQNNGANGGSQDGFLVSLQPSSY